MSLPACFALASSKWMCLTKEATLDYIFSAHAAPGRRSMGRTEQQGHNIRKPACQIIRTSHKLSQYRYSQAGRETWDKCAGQPDQACLWGLCTELGDRNNSSTSGVRLGPWSSVPCAAYSHCCHDAAPARACMPSCPCINPYRSLL